MAVITGLAAWHVRNRRHPGWQASSKGRFTIYCGYMLVAIAAYWLVSAQTATAWEWVLGNAWALAAMVAFVSGFSALDRADEVARLMESLEMVRSCDRSS